MGDNGNLLTWNNGLDGWAYRYDPENRLINVEKNSVASARYTYDAGGRRVRSWDTAGTTDYVYSGLSVIDEVRGGVHERHVYAGSMHLASISSGTTEYFHVDHLGSTRLKTDASGNAIYGSNYEPYGPEYGESGSEEFRYTGKQEDPTGLYYFRARYYDPVTGRFTTRDSFPGYRSDPQSLNRYSYCRNNPQKYTDPTGQIADPVTIGVGLIIGGSMLFGYLSNPVTMNQLFVLGNQIIGMFSLAPPPTASASESIEQVREQNWSSYGAYSGTSNPSTVIEQAQNNGITNQADSESKLQRDKQGKHDPYHRNYRKGSSVLTYPDPSALGAKKGTGTQISPSKERVVFDEMIGIYRKDTQELIQTQFTNIGIFHTDKNGFWHIIPANPGVPLP